MSALLYFVRDHYKVEVYEQGGWIETRNFDTVGAALTWLKAHGFQAVASSVPGLQRFMRFQNEGS